MTISAIMRWTVTFTTLLVCMVVVLSSAVTDPDEKFVDEALSFAGNLRRELVKMPATEVPPLVFIIGVQKGGSSSLMWMMITHPQLCEGARKETHFFGGNYENLVDAGTKSKDIKAEYYSLFTDKKCNGISNSSYVDGTPILHQAYWASKNINAMYTETGYKDKLKFIAMLREPISRDFSWYQHHMRQYLTGHKTGKGFSDSRKGSIKDVKTFKETWEEQILAVKKGKMKRSDVPNDIGGDYVYQVKEFMKYFRRDQLFVMNSNHAFRKTHEAMESIRQFLDVEKWPKWETDPFPHDDHLGSTNNSDDPECVFRHIPKMDCDFRDLLAEHYSSTNAALDTWFKNTKKDGSAPPEEPAWEPFGDSYKNISCVADARGELDEIIKKDTKDYC